jgi:phosphate transport system permease protein
MLNSPHRQSLGSGQKTLALKGNPTSPKVILSGLLSGLAGLCLCLTLGVLLVLILFIVVRAMPRFNWDLITQLPPPPGYEEGGVANALLGTLIVVTLATLITVPIGLSAAIYLAELSQMDQNQLLARGIRFAVQILSGLPSIMAGVFVYAVLVKTKITGYSAWAGAGALAIVMLPTVVRTSDAALQSVPLELRFASLAAGASWVQSTLRVVLPAAGSTLLAGITLAIARAAGETAPLIFTSLFSPYWPRSLSEPIATLSVLIYNFANMPFQPQQQLAWSGSVILVGVILVASLLSGSVGRQYK